MEKSDKGLLLLPIREIALDTNHHDVMMLEDLTRKEKEKKIRKVHNIMGHPVESVLKKFFHESYNNDKETQEIVEEVSRSCTACLKHKKTPPRPKAGLPLSSDFNEVVALDLRINSRNKKNIYFML